VNASSQRPHQEKAVRTPAHLPRKIIRLDAPERDREGRIQTNVRVSEFYQHQPAKRYVGPSMSIRTIHRVV